MRAKPANPRRRVYGAVLGVALVLGAVFPWSLAPQATAATSSTWNYSLATGVRLTRIRYPSVPNEVRILKVVPGSGPRVDITPAGSAFPMWSETSTMAAGQQGVVAAVNGDFATSTGAPSHTTMIDGELWTSGFTPGTAFAWSNDGQKAYVGHPVLNIMLTKVLGKKLFSIREWNAGRPLDGTIVGYTPRGGSTAKPPGAVKPTSKDPRWCAARLVPEAGFGYRWNNGTLQAITRRYVVDSQPEPCRKTPMSLGSDQRNVVLVAKNGTPGATKVLALTPGDKVKVWTEFVGWPGVTDVIGSSQQLLENGVNVAPDYYQGADYILWYNPRTAVGIVPGCKDEDLATACIVYIMTVDGRQSSTNWSKGLKLPGLAAELKKLGVSDAVNLDGGGTTTMWVKKRSSAYCQTNTSVGGCLVNRPSYKYGERTTIEALSVLAGGDTGTPYGLR